MEQFSRRSLPHWYMPGAAHFLTYRLAGTMPARVVEELKMKRERLLNEKPKRAFADHRCNVHKLLFAAYDKHLDAMLDIDWLRNPRLTSMLRQNLYHHDGTRYHLHAYCIMPNHVHVVLTPSPSEYETRSNNSTSEVGESSDKVSPLSKILHSLKSYTANEANKILKRSGRFWQPESYDHWIRNDDEQERIVNYVRENPVAAKLVKKPEDWHWSSCHDRFLYDGDTSGWLMAT